MSNTQNKKVAIFGSTPVEELFIKRLIEEGISADSFQSISNPMIAKAANQTIDLNDISDDELIAKLREYDIIHLSTDESIISKSTLLSMNNIKYIGGNKNQFIFEEDKSKIFEIITQTDILPETEIITSLDSLHKFNQNTPHVLKFVGDNSKFSNGNISSRVKIVDKLESQEAQVFVKNSLSVSGKVLVQRRIIGDDFSSNYFVDENLNFFNLGLNVCYKHLNDNDTGPLCGGTGSYTIAGSVPFINKEEEEHILSATKEFISKINLLGGRKYIGPLNLDLIKDRKSGKIYLLEINFRRPGIHTSASLFNNLENCLFEIYANTLNGSLSQIKSKFSNKASIAVSAYPSYYPYIEPSNLQVIEFNKDQSKVKSYFGWIEIIKETEATFRLKLHSSNSVIFQYSDTNLDETRRVLYDEINRKVPELNYRTDIGKLK